MIHNINFGTRIKISHSSNTEEAVYGQAESLATALTDKGFTYDPPIEAGYLILKG